MWAAICIKIQKFQSPIVGVKPLATGALSIIYPFQSPIVGVKPQGLGVAWSMKTGFNLLLSE